jgi:translation initiation factor IF-2
MVAEPEEPGEVAQRATGHVKTRRRVPEPEAEEIAPPAVRTVVPRVNTRLGRLRPVTDDKTPGMSLPGMPRHAPPSSMQRRLRRGTRRGRPSPGSRPLTPESGTRSAVVEIETPLTIRSFSEATGVRAPQIIRKLMEMGQMARINDALSPETAQLLGIEFGYEIKVRERVGDLQQEIARTAQETPDRPEDLTPRPPIVTFLGHVDHGKTSLLDAIRKTSVAAGEAGGITQHIGAYRAQFPDEKAVVFLDTPGHEAFTAMRARGANVTDIAVLVVAADDGVMPQTEEALAHARAAKVVLMVALNKCDKPEANPARVMQQLAGLGVLSDKWGGDTVFVEVSAVTGQGVDTLVDMISLVAQMRELKANPAKKASGTVLEARLLEGRGVVANVLVQDGTLRRGDCLVAGSGFGRVKSLQSDTGKRLREAGPSTPVEISGLDVVPAAGDKFYAIDDLQLARAAAEQRRQQDREQALASARRHVTLESLFSQMAQGAPKELRVIIKADVRGTIEALQGIIRDLGNPEVNVNVLHSGVGGITVSDVLLADASDAVIVGLHVAPSPEALALAQEKGVDIRTYSIIYRVQEELRQALEGMLEPEEREVIQGHAEVLQTFKSSKAGVIAGCSVRDGVVLRNANMRVIRDGVVIYRGRVGSLRRGKDDAREVREGFECGITVENFSDIKIGDRLEAYAVEQIRRTLKDTSPDAGGETKRP